MKFQCQNSGKCCKINPNEHGYVFLTEDDTSNLEIATGLHRDQFSFLGRFDSTRFSKTPRYARVIAFAGTKCRFLVNNKCSVHAVKPTQCKTWPFWPEYINDEAKLKRDFGFCKGLGKGETIAERDAHEAYAIQIAADRRY